MESHRYDNYGGCAVTEYLEGSGGENAVSTRHMLHRSVDTRVVVTSYDASRLPVRRTL